MQEVVTRWNATYLIIERLLVLKNNSIIELEQKDKMFNWDGWLGL